MKKLLCLLVGGVLGFAADSPLDATFQAIRNNDLAGLQTVVKDRAAANTKDDRGITPVMYAAFAGSPEAMKFLIDKGADVNAKNAFESTALMWSVTDMKKVRMLVEGGANVNARSKAGRTPALLAAMSDGSAEIVRLLISKGADLKAVDAMRTGLLSAA